MESEKLTAEILEKLKDRKFLTEIFKSESKEEIIKAFAKENIKISGSQVDTLGALIDKIISEMQKLSEKELENVSAGSVSSGLAKAVGYYFMPAGYVAGKIFAALDNNGFNSPQYGDSYKQVVKNNTKAVVGHTVGAAVICTEVYLTYKACQFLKNKVPTWVSNAKNKHSNK